MAAQQHHLPDQYEPLLLRAADTFGDRRDVPNAGIRVQKLYVGPPAQCHLEHRQVAVAVLQLKHGRTHRGTRGCRQPQALPRCLSRMEARSMDQYPVNGHPMELQPDLQRHLQGALLAHPVHRLPYRLRLVQRHLPLGSRRHRRRCTPGQQHIQPSDLVCRRAHQFRRSMEQNSLCQGRQQALCQQPPQQRRHAPQASQIRAHL